MKKKVKIFLPKVIFSNELPSPFCKMPIQFQSPLLPRPFHNKKSCLFANTTNIRSHFLR